MAIFQLGSIVTNIVGSIGGTTFKRQGSSSVMMRKSNGQSRSKLLSNTRINNNSLIFKIWNNLTSSDKLAWNAIASSTKVKDKFGNDVKRSGIAMQRKCYLAAQVFFINTIDPSLFTTDVNSLTIGDVTIDWSDRILKMFYNAPDGTTNIGVMIEYSQKNLPAPSFIRRGVAYVFEGNGDSFFSQDLDDIPKLAFLNSNYNLRVYVYVCNANGWTSPQQFKDVILA